MVEVNLKFPFIHKRRAIEVSRGQGWPSEEKGSVSIQQRWTDRRPHPANMSNYDKWANDAEANIAFNVLADIIAGVGYYTEMPEGKEEHKNKEVIDDYGETVNLDEDLQEITMTMLQKGFCPVERLEDYDLKILPPETFYIHEDRKGNVLKYTQEYTAHSPVATWEGKEMDDIILFFHRKTTSWPYGKSLTEPIGGLLNDRDQMNEDMPAAVHRWAYPMAVMETSGSKADLETAVKNRAVDEWIFIGNVQENEVRWNTVQIDPQARFIPYIELIYYQICEGLHAPLLLYLKNATEASANVMLESVDRLVNGIQRYIKRRVERFLFEPQVGEPVPRLVWGQPKTGLEETTFSDLAAVLPFMAKNQQQDVLKHFMPWIPEPEWEKQPQLPFQPFQKQPVMPPIEQLVEKMNDLTTQLNVIETNYQEHRIALVKAMQLGGRVIDVHCKRLYGKHEQLFNEHRDQEYEKWAHRLLGVEKRGGKVFKVSVAD